MSNDFYLSIFVIIIFLLITFYGVILFHFSLIKKMWPTIQCNPLVMPFASFFGKDPLDNFTHCIQNIQKDSMESLLSPINLNINTLGGISNSLVLSNLNIRKAFAFLRNSSSNLIGSSFSLFSNLIIEIQKLGNNIKDVIGKMAGSMMVLVNILNGTTKTMKSLWRGPPGDTLRAVTGLSTAIRNTSCFHPDTILKLYDGTYVKMQDIKLGVKLKNGSKVEGILKLNNLEENNHKEILYKFENGENNTPLYVTGYHLILLNNKFDYVKNHKDCSPCNLNCDYLYCLITNNNLIPIGDYTFWDWEDTPEMTSHLK